MRIAVELPDELLRRIKVHAAMTDQRLKVLMPTILGAGPRRDTTRALNVANSAGPMSSLSGLLGTVLLLVFSVIGSHAFGADVPAVGQKFEPTREQRITLEKLRVGSLNGDLETVRQVLQDREIPTDWNFGRVGPALYYACMRGHSNVVEFLLERGANPNFQNRYGAGPMMTVAERGDESTLKLLLKYGANPSGGVDLNGWTPLIAASLRGHSGVVRTLIDAGADVNARVSDGHTALSWARAGGHAAIVRMLEQAGAR